MRRAIAVAAAVACLTVAGCGSGDDTGSVTGSDVPTGSADTAAAGTSADEGDGTPVGRTEPAGALELVRVRLAKKRLAPKVEDADAPAIARLRVGAVDVLAYREPTDAVQAAGGIRQALGSGGRPANDVGIVEVVGTHLYTTSVAKGRLDAAERSAFDRVVRVGERP